MWEKKEAIKITVFGVVQGVGFRPFVYRLAKKLNYSGWVKNLGLGVEIFLEKQGKSDFSDFLQSLQTEKPPLCVIKEIKTKFFKPKGLKNFKIKPSKEGESFVFISPDISICQECFSEMKNTKDRRYHYPFINCTNCGPRYTIVKSLPYDRDKTTMKDFSMCTQCQQEYENPLDRRYHAQPIACPICGPQIELIETKTGKKIKDALQKAISYIKQGKILGVKGLGGFHLICDALNPESVSKLRKIKERKTKPFALLAKDLEIIKKYAYLSREEEKFLVSARRPIVLLKAKKQIRAIAPYLNELGFMLPYTPLHYLLMSKLDLVVATSSNKKDAPIIKEEREGIYELCDYLLTHNRPIEMRADDSVMKIIGTEPLFLRRARGYVPEPQDIPEELKSSSHILALGGELKDTISIYKNGYIVTSQFLGDLDEYQNFRYFKETLTHLSHLFEVKPEVVISDLHPDFQTTKFARKMNIPYFQIQHHFAHILAPMIEQKIPPFKKVLGVAFDGYGYGDDGNAWGGEFLICDYSSYQRFAYFKYLPLPGSDLAAKQPWRMTLSYLKDVYGKNIPDLPAFEKVNSKKIKGVLAMIDHKTNSPLTSSCGRLFDAVSFLLGIAPLEVEYEAEAPMRLEAISSQLIDEFYEFELVENNPIQISFQKTIKAILYDLKRNEKISFIASKFHNTLAQIIRKIAHRVREKYKIDLIALSGGVFLNKILLSSCLELLSKDGFKVIRPINYSPNDESLSLGQIAYGLKQITDGK